MTDPSRTTVPLYADQLVRSPLPPGVQHPCADCDGVALWIENPPIAGCNIVVSHDDSCPFLARVLAEGRA